MLYFCYHEAPSEWRNRGFPLHTLVSVDTKHHVMSIQLSQTKGDERYIRVATKTEIRKLKTIFAGYAVSEFPEEFL